MQSRTGRAVFARLPGTVQDRFRALGSKPVPPIDTELDDATRAELSGRLAPDLAIFRTIAPDVVARWEHNPDQRGQPPPEIPMNGPFEY